jgi:hypothetical protein
MTAPSTLELRTLPQFQERHRDVQIHPNVSRFIPKVTYMENQMSMRLCSRVRAGLSFILRGRLRALLALATAAAALGIDAPCRANLVIEAPSITVAPGSSGSFDVLITSTGGTFSVAADDIELTLAGLSTVSFTGISIATVTPYIYGANSASLNGSTFIINVSSNDVEAFDFEYPSGSQTINTNGVFGLLNVQYTVAANAVPGSTGTLGIGPDTSLSDETGNTVSFTSQNGSVTVASSIIPEPSSAALLAIGCAMVLVRAANKRTARAKH